MRPFGCAWSLSVTWQRWRLHHLIRHIRKPHATRKRYGTMCYIDGVIADRNCTLREWGFSTFFASVTLTLIRWPSYMNLEINRMSKNELRTSRLSKVIAWQTDRQTDRRPRNYIPRRFAGDQKVAIESVQGYYWHSLTENNFHTIFIQILTINFIGIELVEVVFHYAFETFLYLSVELFQRMLSS